MAEEYITFEIDEDDVMRGFDLQEFALHQHLKELLDDMADKGKEILERYAPESPEGDAYTKRHVDRSHVAWMPGGAGGGGQYEVIVGVKAGASYHPVYANVGTGVYSYTEDYIRSPKGGLMWFYASRLGRVISMYAVAGQRPQRFLYETWRDLSLLTEMRVILLSRGL